MRQPYYILHQEEYSRWRQSLIHLQFVREMQALLSTGKYDYAQVSRRVGRYCVQHKVHGVIEYWDLCHRAKDIGPFVGRKSIHHNLNIRPFIILKNADQCSIRPLVSTCHVASRHIVRVSFRF